MSEQDKQTGSLGVQHIEISEHDIGQRLDNFLKKILKGVPTSKVYGIIRTGQVRINSKRAKPLYKLKAGDVVRVPPVRVSEVSSDEPPAWLIQNIKDSIAYEDDYVVLINKRGGIAVHSGSGVPFGVIETLKYIRQDEYIELVHRIDRETSGCLLLAKSATALRELNAGLRDGLFDKQYLALLKGKLQREQTIELAIAKDQRGGEKTMQVGESGKAALSTFKPLAVTDMATLCEVAIGTGRTHQIRVHSQSMRKPLAGDDKYGDRPFNKVMKSMGLKRMFLHAARLTVPVSWQKDPYEFSSPLPDELKTVVQALGMEWSDD